MANRIHKVLEDANIKLGAVASDILGKSGRATGGTGSRPSFKLTRGARGKTEFQVNLKLGLTPPSHGRSLRRIPFIFQLVQRFS